MKKSIKIATLGVAALGVAALPLASAFAVESANKYQDELDLTVGQTCSFARLEDHEHGEEGWGTASDLTTDIFARSVEAGTEYGELAHSNFKVTCNDVTTLFEVAFDTETSDGWIYNAGGFSTETGVSSWTLASNGLGANVGSGMAIQKTTADSTKEYEFQITYGAKFDASADAGLYTATTEYTFAENV